MKIPQIEIEDGKIVNKDDILKWAYNNCIPFRSTLRHAKLEKLSKEDTQLLIIYALMRLNEELLDLFKEMRTGAARTSEEIRAAMESYLREVSNELKPEKPTDHLLDE